MVKELLTVKQLANELSVTTRTVYNWISDGMPTVKVGYHNRFDIDVVMNWFEEQNENRNKEGK